MQLKLDSLSDPDWRERIGNAVPPDAVAAIASTVGTTLMPAWIAANNDTAWLTNALDDDVIPSVTASLVADLFGRTEDEINRDLTRELKRQKIEG